MRILLISVMALAACAPRKDSRGLQVDPPSKFGGIADWGSGWHRATQKECNAEIEREYREMAKAGWCCDPPITMGFWMGSLSEKGMVGIGWSPCAYTDGVHFRGARVLDVGGKSCELTEAQEDYLYIEHTETLPSGGSFRVRDQSPAHFETMASLCRSGKLPDWRYSWDDRK